MKRIWLVTISMMLTVGCTKKQAQAPQAQAGAMQLFSLDGTVYTKDNLPSKISSAIHEQEKRYHNGLTTVINRFVVDKYVEDIAKKEGKSAEAVRDELFKVGDPTEKELKAFYDKNKARIPYPYEKVKAQLKTFMGQETRFNKQNELLEKAKKKYGFVSLLALSKAKPVNIDTSKFPTKGNQSSKIVVVEFADYQCPHCGHFYAEFKEAFASLKDKIKFVFIDFPINSSGISTTVAEGAYCARQQSKFWEFHDLAFTNQATLSNASAEKFAKDLSLDMAKFAACMKSKDVKDYITAAKTAGENAGVTGTPAIFVNGVKAEGGVHGVQEAIKLAAK